MHNPSQPTFLEMSTAQITTLIGWLRAADKQPATRTRRTLELMGSLDTVVTELRERAIIAALAERKLSMREIGHLVGLSVAQVHARARAAGLDTSKPPATSPAYMKRRAASRW